MRVAIVGTGGVAEALSSALRGKVELTIVGRDAERVEQLGGGATMDEAVDADIYIFAVSDRAVAQLTEQVHFAEGATVAHTAGSIAMEDIAEREGIERGVFYPLQSFSRGRAIDLNETPIFIEAESEHGQKRLEELARMITNRVSPLNSEARRQLHMAAIFASNFTSAMMVATHDIVHRYGIPLDAYQPLISESIAKVTSTAGDPIAMVTGPARRGDAETQQRHITMMEHEAPELVDMYKIISKYIWETSKRI